MEIATHKASNMQFRKPQSMVKQDWASAHHIGDPNNSIITHNIYFKGTRQLGASIKTRADFIIAGLEKGSFQVVEMKKGTGIADARRLSSYLQTPIMVGDYYILLSEMDVHASKGFICIGVETLPQLIEVARPIEISYPNRALVETLLGSQEKHVLEQVLSVVKDLALKMDWPLNKVEIRYF